MARWELPGRFLDSRLQERGRAFSIENGQIENLNTLRRGVAEDLVAEGLQTVMGAHTLEGLPDTTIQYLLKNQTEALGVMFLDVAGGQPFTQQTIRSWHAILTRHHETVTGLRLSPDGKRVMRVQIPFLPAWLATRAARFRVDPGLGSEDSETPLSPIQGRLATIRRWWNRPRCASTQSGPIAQRWFAVRM